MPSFNLKGKVSLDSTEFQAGLRRVKLASAATAKTIGNSFRQIGGSLQKITASLAKFAAIAATVTFAAATAGAVKLGRELRKAFDVGGALSDLSSRTGIAVKELVILEQAFEDNGISADKVGAIINKMQKGISDFGAGLSTQVRAFERLGITYDDIRNKSPLQQFQMLQNSLAKIPDPTLRAATAMDIFGRSGGELQALFNDAGAIGKAAQTIGTQADILDKNAQTFDRISDLLNSAGKKLQGFFVGIASVAAPKILEVLEKFNTLDLAQLGQNIASNLNMENALEVIKAAFKVAAAFLGNAVLEALARATVAFGELWAKMSKHWVDGLKNGLEEGLARALVAVLAPFGVVIAGLDGLAKGKQGKADLGGMVTDFLDDKLDGDFFGLEDATKNLKDAVEALTKPSGPPADRNGGALGTTAPPGGSLPAPTGGGHHAIDAALARGAEKASKRVSRLDQHRDMFGKGMALMPALPKPGSDHKSRGFHGLAALEQLQIDKADGVSPGFYGIGAKGGLGGAPLGTLNAMRRAGVAVGAGGIGATGGLGAVKAVGRKEAADAAEGKRVFQDQLSAANEQIRIQEEQLAVLQEGLAT